jgi:hypothetical protein
VVWFTAVLSNTEFNSLLFIDFGRDRFTIVQCRMNKNSSEEVNKVARLNLSFLSTLISFTILLLSKINWLTIHVNNRNANLSINTRKTLRDDYNITTRQREVSEAGGEVR